MKELFKNIVSDKTLALAFLINILFIIATLIFILFSYSSLPPFIPIFNQLPWGEQRLGSTITILIPVLAALLVLLINLFISAAIYKKNTLIARILAAISLLVSVLTFLFVVKTITLIT